MSASIVNENILKHFGGITKNNFKTIYDASDDIDNSINLISESPYIDPPKVPNYLE